MNLERIESATEQKYLHQLAIAYIINVLLLLDTFVSVSPIVCCGVFLDYVGRVAISLRGGTARNGRFETVVMNTHFVDNMYDCQTTVVQLNGGSPDPRPKQQDNLFRVYLNQIHVWEPSIQLPVYECSVDGRSCVGFASPCTGEPAAWLQLDSVTSNPYLTIELLLQNVAYVARVTPISGRISLPFDEVALVQQQPLMKIQTPSFWGDIGIRGTRVVIRNLDYDAAVLPSTAASGRFSATLSLTAVHMPVLMVQGITRDTSNTLQSFSIINTTVRGCGHGPCIDLAGRASSSTVAGATKGLMLYGTNARDAFTLSVTAPSQPDDSITTDAIDVTSLCDDLYRTCPGALNVATASGIKAGPGSAVNVKIDRIRLHDDILASPWLHIMVGPANDIVDHECTSRRAKIHVTVTRVVRFADEVSDYEHTTYTPFQAFQVTDDPLVSAVWVFIPAQVRRVALRPLDLPSMQEQWYDVTPLSLVPVRAPEMLFNFGRVNRFHCNVVSNITIRRMQLKAGKRRPPALKVRQFWAASSTARQWTSEDAMHTGLRIVDWIRTIYTRQVFSESSIQLLGVWTREEAMVRRAAGLLKTTLLRNSDQLAAGTLLTAVVENIAVCENRTDTDCTVQLIDSDTVSALKLSMKNVDHVGAIHGAVRVVAQALFSAVYSAVRTALVSLLWATQTIHSTVSNAELTRAPGDMAACTSPKTEGMLVLCRLWFPKYRAIIRDSRLVGTDILATATASTTSTSSMIQVRHATPPESAITAARLEVTMLNLQVSGGRRSSCVAVEGSRVSIDNSSFIGCNSADALSAMHMQAADVILDSVTVLNCGALQASMQLHSTGHSLGCIFIGEYMTSFTADRLQMEDCVGTGLEAGACMTLRGFALERVAIANATLRSSRKSVGSVAHIQATDINVHDSVFHGGEASVGGCLRLRDREAEASTSSSIWTNPDQVLVRRAPNVTVNNTSLVGGRAVDSGGCLGVEYLPSSGNSATVELLNLSVVNCSSERDGGGVWISGALTTRLQDILVANSSAGVGPGYPE